jgi:hypothetical protein
MIVRKIRYTLTPLGMHASEESAALRRRSIGVSCDSKWITSYLIFVRVTPNADGRKTGKLVKVIKACCDISAWQRIDSNCSS